MVRDICPSDTSRFGGFVRAWFSDISCSLRDPFSKFKTLLEKPFRCRRTWCSRYLPSVTVAVPSYVREQKRNAHAASGGGVTCPSARIIQVSVLTKACTVARKRSWMPPLQYALVYGQACAASAQCSLGHLQGWRPCFTEVTLRRVARVRKQTHLERAR